MSKAKLKKTNHPGIKSLPDGRFIIDTTATCPQTKKRHRFRETMPEGTTLKDAIARRDAIKEEVKRKPFEEPLLTPQRLTLAGYADEWLKRKAPRLKPNTHETYSQIITDHIIPKLGTLYADIVIRADVEEWVVWAESQHQANSTLYIIPSPQVLRRTYNSLMVRAGVDRIILRSQIGHVSEEMTERYMGVSDEDKHEAVAKVLNLKGVTL